MKPFEPFARPVVQRHLGAHESDMAVACLEDGLGHFAASTAVRDTDHRVHRLAVGVHDFHYGNACIAQHGAGGIRVFKARDDHA